jgi:hypothetical protein
VIRVLEPPARTPEPWHHARVLLEVENVGTPSGALCHRRGGTVMVGASSGERFLGEMGVLIPRDVHQGARLRGVQVRCGTGRYRVDVDLVDGHLLVLRAQLGPLPVEVTI